MGEKLPLHKPGDLLSWHHINVLTTGNGSTGTMEEYPICFLVKATMVEIAFGGMKLVHTMALHVLVKESPSWILARAVILPSGKTERREAICLLLAWEIGRLPSG